MISHFFTVPFLAVETVSLNTMSTTVKRGNLPDESSRRLLYKKR